MLLAETRKRAGDGALSNFILLRARRQIEELIAVVNEMGGSVEQEAYSQLSRMEKLRGV